MFAQFNRVPKPLLIFSDARPMIKPKSMSKTDWFTVQRSITLPKENLFAMFFMNQ